MSDVTAASAQWSRSNFVVIIHTVVRKPYFQELA